MNDTRKLSLGLQGGGSYGAFGWGVLDRLLADERFDIDGIGAASAGAVNAAVLADGYARGGGKEGARRSLARFWTALGQSALLGPMRPSPFDYFAGRAGIETSPGFVLMQLLTAALSPVQLSALNIHPLSTLLSTLIDFERVRDCTELKLFISGTNVRTGQGHVFRREHLGQAGGGHDGSLAGNPPLGPLVGEAQARDILIVQNNPISRRDLPLSMADVHSRLNEIAFNISFVREVTALRRTASVVDEETGAGLAYGQMRLHLVSGVEFLRDLSISSKFNMDWAFIQQLHDLGAAACGRWLDEHADKVGVASTLDPAHVYASTRETAPGTDVR
jgi:NTE family protein